MWKDCTKVAEAAVWVLIEDTRRLGGNAVGNVAAAARLLGVQRTHLHQRLVALEVPRPDSEGEDT